jgi:hypothetical protein
VTLALFGGGESILVAHEIVMCFLLIAMVFMYRWARAENLSIGISAAVVVMFALMPSTYLMSFNVWTENLYLLFSLAAIAALARDSVTSERMWALAAVAVCAALLTRVAALPLAVAFLFYLVKHRPRRMFPLAAIAIVPFAIWAAVSALTQRGAGAYVAHLQGKYSGNPVQFFMHQATVESQALYHAWLDAWLGQSPTAVAAVIVVIFGVLGLAGWLLRLRALRFDAVYVALYLAMLIVWPHPEEAQRYSYVLFPLLLVYACLILSRLPGYRINARTYNLTTAGGVLLAFIAMLPTLLLNISYYTENTLEEYADNKHTAEWYVTDRRRAASNAVFRTALLNHLKSLSGKVEEGECIFAIKPTIVSLYSKRRSYGPPNSTKNDTEFLEEIGRCRYVYVLPFASPSYRVAFYPQTRLGARAELISEMRMTGDVRSPMVGALYRIAPQ